LINSEANHIFFIKIKQKLRANMPKGVLNKFNVQTKSNSKPNDFK